MSTQVYNATGGGLIGLFPNPVIAARDPVSTDIVSPSGQPYQIFQGWNNQLTDATFIYLGGGNWVTIASIAGGVTQLTGNAGVATPVGGNINIVGAGTLSFAGAGSTITGTITPGTGLIATLTGNSGGALSPTAGNMNIVGNNALGINISGSGSTLTAAGIQGSVTQVGVWEGATGVETQTGTDATRVVTPASLVPSLITPYVVGPGGAYTTIQSAITAANAAGGGVVYIKPGAYTENLTLFDGVDLYGTPAVSQNQGASVSITGTHIPPASGHVGFNSICFISTTDVFLSVVAGTTHLVFLNCESAVQNGYFLNLLNWTGILEIFDNNPNTAGAPFAVNDGGINNTGGATLFMFDAALGSGTNVMNLSGLVVCQGTSFGCPVNFQTGSVIAMDDHIFAQTTFSNDSTGAINTSRFSSGAAAAITMSSSGSIEIATSIVSSSNNPAIAGAGAGTLSLGDITFTSNSAVSGTLTVVYLPTRLGNAIVTGAITSSTTITAGTGITSTTGDITATAGNLVATLGNLNLNGAASKININVATGASASAGVSAAMVAGAVTITSTAITTSSIIHYSRNILGTAMGNVSITAQPSGSFTLTSDEGTETSTFYWWVIN